MRRGRLAAFSHAILYVACGCLYIHKITDCMDSDYEPSAFTATCTQKPSVSVMCGKISRQKPISEDTGKVYMVCNAQYLFLTMT